MNTDMQARVTVRQQRYEQLLCAAAARQPDYTRRTCGWLRPETFSDPACRKFWQGFQQHGNTDRAALDAQILSALVEWQGDALVRDATAAPELARKVQEAAWLAGVSAQMGRLLRGVSDGDGEQVRELLRQMSDGGLTRAADIPTVARTHEKFMATILDPRRVLPTRTKLDRYMGGLIRKRQTGLAGMTGTGKSALALQFARNIAASGEEVCFFALEMSEEDIWARMACGALRLNYDTVLAQVGAGTLTAATAAQIEQVSAQLRDTYPTLHIYDSAQTVDSIWQHTATVRAALVVVDHVMLVKYSGRGDGNETTALGKITERFKDMAKALDCNVLTLVQLNRKLFDRTDKHPTLADIRQSGEIAQNVDEMLALYRELDKEKRQIDAEGNTAAELWSLKHRTGSDNDFILFRYNLPEQWFYD